MFEGMKGLAGLAGLMKDLPRIKERMEEVKARLEQQTVDAETGGGAVRATVNGAMRVVDLHVDHSMLASLVDASNPDDLVLARELIVGAVNAAMEKARQLAEQELASAAGELGVPLPPGGIGGLMR
jgi:DNA-binding protein YbaB